MSEPVIKARKVEYRRNANGGMDCTIYPNVLVARSKFGDAVVNKLTQSNVRRAGIFTDKSN